MTPISATTNRTGKGQVEAGLSHSPKLQPWHLDRLAVVYVRQSSPQQVAENRESTDRQYGVPIATEKKTTIFPGDGSPKRWFSRILVPLRLGPEILRDLDSDNRSRMGFLESRSCGRVSRSHIAEIALQEGKFVVFFSVAIGTPTPAPTPFIPRPRTG